jgi:hypothetical protein
MRSAVGSVKNRVAYRRLLPTLVVVTGLYYGVLHFAVDHLENKIMERFWRGPDLL